MYFQCAQCTVALETIKFLLVSIINNIVLMLVGFCVFFLRSMENCISILWKIGNFQRSENLKSLAFQGFSIKDGGKKTKRYQILLGFYFKSTIYKQIQRETKDAIRTYSKIRFTRIDRKFMRLNITYYEIAQLWDESNIFLTLLQLKNNTQVLIQFIPFGVKCVNCLPIHFFYIVAVAAFISRSTHNTSNE